VDQAGRITIPTEIRKALGLEPGTQVVLEAGADGVRVRTWGQTLRAVQDYLAPYRSPDVSVVDEFLSERREEAAQEERE
jgi:AbrB family looped-hinge helix DNA binding protein